jgi:hypothetical protein
MTLNRWLCSVPVVAAVTLAGCGTSTTAPPWFVRDYPGLPGDESPTQPGTPQGLVDTVVWGAADQIAVVTFGSSSCPKLPVHLGTSAANTLTITLSSGMSPIVGVSEGDAPVSRRA